MLYFVPTPIGNLGDITLRALEVLRNADIIYAEDTRHTIKLLNHYDIKKPLVSYHQHNEAVRCEKIASEVISGLEIALVSDAGTPGVSDPGGILAKYFATNNIEFTVLPGANAVLPALVLSGLDTNRFCFEGFLPRDKKKLNDRLAALSSSGSTLVFYESPRRVRLTLEKLFDAFGDRSCAICREISKMHESVYRGLLSSVQTELPENILGECVIVVEGHNEVYDYDIKTILDKMTGMINDGMKVKDAAKSLASPMYSANELFRLYLEN